MEEGTRRSADSKLTSPPGEIGLLVSSSLETDLRSEYRIQPPDVADVPRNDTLVLYLEPVAKLSAGDIGLFSTGWEQSVRPPRLEPDPGLTSLESWMGLADADRANPAPDPLTPAL